MRRGLAVGVVAAALALPLPAATAATTARQRECNDRYQDCRDQQHRGNFSPGPFDRSPVDVHDNQICISPDCSGRSNGATTTTTTTGGGR